LIVGMVVLIELCIFLMFLVSWCCMICLIVVVFGGM